VKELGGEYDAGGDGELRAGVAEGYREADEGADEGPEADALDPSATALRPRSQAELLFR
jgi:hypothetical protein